MCAACWPAAAGASWHYADLGRHFSQDPPRPAKKKNSSAENLGVPPSDPPTRGYPYAGVRSGSSDNKKAGAAAGGLTFLAIYLVTVTVSTVLHK